jgi:hypothetical protein
MIDVRLPENAWYLIKIICSNVLEMIYLRQLQNVT